MPQRPNVQSPREDGAGRTGGGGPIIYSETSGIYKTPGEALELRVWLFGGSKSSGYSRLLFFFFFLIESREQIIC